MINPPKTTLINNIDDLDLYFFEGENELEFEIDDYSFTVVYSLEFDDILVDDNTDNSIKGDKKLKILSINAYDNIENEDFNVLVDDEIQKLFVDYYLNTLADDNFEPINVNFGEFSDILDE